MPTAVIHYNMARVCRAVACEQGLRLDLGDGGSVILESAHEHYSLLRVIAENAVGRPLPVGFVLEGSRVLDLNQANDGSIRLIREDSENPRYLAVVFWSFSMSCHLDREHPEFERIVQTLRAAQQSSGRVWFVNHSQMVDLIFEGETVAGWSLMDVRAIE